MKKVIPFLVVGLLALAACAPDKPKQPAEDAYSPFTIADLPALRTDAPGVVQRLAPTYAGLYDRLGWTMFREIDRVYVNEKARRELGWNPVYDFGYVLKQLEAGMELQSPLAKVIGVKGYHESV